MGTGFFGVCVCGRAQVCVCVLACVHACVCVCVLKRWVVFGEGFHGVTFNICVRS